MILFGLPLPTKAANWRDVLPQANLIGRGDLRWFGLRIYTAQLWSEKPAFDAKLPFVLELNYHRDISKAQFVETSLDEIKRLWAQTHTPATLKRWENEMNRAFIDVKTGDTLAAVFLPKQGVQFYSKNQILAEVRDLDFAQAFFAIWFDVRTKDQKLRAQLLSAS
ncbi:MAG: chalcone isomerase family protein [Neisseriaceae bacterium]|nr:chalcone isomerase family protein [Neisseriaceae bacterium]